jgi:hypothetical protein
LTVFIRPGDSLGAFEAYSLAYRLLMRKEDARRGEEA